MNARTRGSFVVVMAVVSLWPLTASAAAITFSTSGTIAASNEPDQRLHGVSAEALSGPNPGDPGFNPLWPLSFGEIAIVPFTGFNNVDPPNLTGAPFDITVAFNAADLPTLELKGTFHDTNGERGVSDVGLVSAITSSNPALDANLPAPFAAMLADPGGIRLGIPFGDYGMTSLPVYAALPAVPEPGTAAVFVTLGLLAGLGRKARRMAG